MQKGRNQEKLDIHTGVEEVEEEENILEAFLSRG